MQHEVERYSKEYFLLDRNISPESWYHLLTEVDCIVADGEVLGTGTGKLRPGRFVRKLTAMVIEMKGNRLSEDVLLAIDAHIAHPVLMLLSRGHYIRACMSCKLPGSRRKELPDRLRYHYATPWIPRAELSFFIPPTNLDQLYFSLMQCVAGWNMAPGSMQELEELVRRHPPQERQYHLFLRRRSRPDEDDFWCAWRKMLASLPSFSATSGKR